MCSADSLPSNLFLDPCSCSPAQACFLARKSGVFDIAQTSRRHSPKHRSLGLVSSRTYQLVFFVAQSLGASSWRTLALSTCISPLDYCGWPAFCPALPSPAAHPPTNNARQSAINNNPERSTFARSCSFSLALAPPGYAGRFLLANRPRQS